MAEFLGLKEAAGKNKRKTVFGQPLGDSFFCGPEGWSPIGAHIFKLENAARLGCAVHAKPEGAGKRFESVMMKDVTEDGTVIAEAADGSEMSIPFLQVMKRSKLEQVRQ